MRRARLLALVLLAVAPLTLRAQGSVFAVRGLGLPGRPVSARTAGTEGAFAMFDAQMALNPAAVGRVRAPQAWATAASSSRDFTASTGNASLRATRFPLAGFATAVPQRFGVSVSFSDYLDRTWTLERRDSLVVQGVMEPFRDAERSLGGITDAQLAGAWRSRSANTLMGLGLHLYLGSVRLTSQRLFDNTAYQGIAQEGITDYRGAALSAGVMTTVGRSVELAASGRWSGRLHAENTTGTSAWVGLPWELNGGARVQVVPGILAAATVQYQAWQRAAAALVAGGDQPSRNTWSLSAGAEVQRLNLGPVRTPLRLGYRWRQLPFPSVGEAIAEHAFGAGVGLSFAGDRATMDLALERGSRTAGSATENFTTVFLGLTVRP